MSKGREHDPGYIFTAGKGFDAQVTPKLNSIPPEVFFKIIEVLDAARDLANLSRTCRAFRDLNERDGWRLFVNTRFPSLVSTLSPGTREAPPKWRDIAHCLTTQSRAWDRRSISVTELSFVDTVGHSRPYRSNTRFGPSLSNESSQSAHHSLYRWDALSNSLSRYGPIEGENVDQNGPRGLFPSARTQSTPFHPVIASKMEFAGHLSSTKQVVAFCTGPEVCIRVRRSGSLIPPRRDSFDKSYAVLDEYSNKIDWFSIQDSQFLSGPDDVTSINIIEPSMKIRPSSPEMLVVDLIVGRASGHLHRYSVSDADPIRAVVNTFHSFERNGASSRRLVRSADTNGDTGNQLLVACSDKVLSLYHTTAETHDVWPSTELDIELDQAKSQAWAVKFSSRENVVLGLGQHPKPLHTYKAAPTGLLLTGKFGLPSPEGTLEERSGSAVHSVFAIEPLSAACRVGGSLNGDVFLSGWYDGACRLFDLRASRTPVNSFYDPVDNGSAIYSLAAFGQERFLAGTSSSVLKIFDFRSGAKAYQYSDGLPCSVDSPAPGPSFHPRARVGEQTVMTEAIGTEPFKGRCRCDRRGNLIQTCRFHELSKLSLYRPNAGIFLYGLPRLFHYRVTMRRHKSPIFSISSPSPLCPFVYAGTTGTIYELEISEFNKGGYYTDPTFVAARGMGFEKKVEELVMYEARHVRSGDEVHGMPNKLWTQKAGPRTLNRSLHSRNRRLDYRWH